MALTKLAELQVDCVKSDRDTVRFRGDENQGYSISRDRFRIDAVALLLTTPRGKLRIWNKLGGALRTR